MKIVRIFLIGILIIGIMSLLLRGYYKQPPLSVSIDREITNKNEITVSGTTDNKSLVKIYVSFKDKGILTSFAKPDSKTGSFEKKLMLVNKDSLLTTPQLQADEGTYTIEFCAKNPMGRKTTMVRDVIVDKTPPMLTILQPPTEIYKIEDRSIEIAGKTEPKSKVEVFIHENIKEIPIDSDGKFSITVFLTEKDNEITIKASDSVENSTSTQLMIEAISKVDEEEKKALSAISEAQRAIGKAKKSEAGRYAPEQLRDAEDFLNKAEKTYQDKNYSQALIMANESARKAKESEEKAYLVNRVVTSISNANALIRKAEDSGAEKYAPAMLKDAKNLLAQTEKALDEKNYSQALNLANRALEKAREAKEKAKEEAEQEAKRKAVESAISMANEAIKAAKKAEAEKYAPAMLSEAKKLLAQAKEALNVRNYSDSLGFANRASEKAREAKEESYQKAKEEAEQEVKRKEAESAISMANEAIEAAEKAEAEKYAPAMLSEAKKLLAQAKEALNVRNYSDSLGFANRASEKAREAKEESYQKAKEEAEQEVKRKEAESAISMANKAIEAAEKAEAEKYAPAMLKDAKNLLAQAEKALDEKNYSRALNLANGASEKAREAEEKKKGEEKKTDVESAKEPIKEVVKKPEEKKPEEKKEVFSGTPFQQALTYRDNKNYSKAVEIFSQIKPNEPNYLEAEWNIAILYVIYLERIDEAVDILDKIWRLNNKAENAFISFYKGIAYYKKAENIPKLRKKEAIEEFNKAINYLEDAYRLRRQFSTVTIKGVPFQIPSKNIQDIKYYIALSYYNMNDKNKAIDAFREYLNYDYKDPEDANQAEKILNTLIIR
ncbi:MAG: DUF4398 domain-containing protein [bacterium]